jgi:peptide/nickel transport system ATP-binding protein
VPDPPRTGSYDPRERAALRAAVMESASCAFDGDPEQRCSATEPVRHRVGDPANEHWVRCHLYRPPATAASHALSAEPLEPFEPLESSATDESRTENKASA